MVYTSKRKPRKKQAEALKRLIGKEAFALLMAMRTGKTKVVLDDFGRLELAGKVQDLMVIAPAGVYRTWETAIKEDFSHDLEKRSFVYTWVSGSNSGKAKKLREAFLKFKGPRVLLMNVEALSNVAEAREVCKKFCARGKCYVAIDESTIIKKHTAKRTKFINKVIKPLADYRRILTGLVTPQSPLDLYSQFEFLNPKILGFRSFYGFRANYAVLKNMNFGGREVPIVVGFREDAESELKKIIAPHSFRVRLEDCYDLPPDDFQFIDVEMTKEQKRIYNDLFEFATSKIDSERNVTAKIVIDQMLKLHQVLCGHTKDEYGKMLLIPENRTKTLIDKLEDYDGKAIIWCSYDQDVRKVSEALQDAFGEGKVEGVGPNAIFPNVARFWGGNIKTREEEERRFKTRTDVRWIVATPDAGGRGRTWDMADLVVYYSSKNNLEHRSQSEERPKGIDKTKSIGYFDMRCKGTVEDKIIHALRKKIDMSTMINGDNYKEWLV